MPNAPGVTHLAVYYKRSSGFRSFKFHAGKPQEFPEELDGFDKVLVKKLPEKYSDGSAFLATGANPFGAIQYNVFDKGRHALTNNYAPRGFTRRKTMRGLGAYLEAIATAHLAKEGVTHISTSSDPSQARINQLERVGLPALRTVPIGEWLRKICRGFKQQQSPDAQQL